MNQPATLVLRSLLIFKGLAIIPHRLALEPAGSWPAYVSAMPDGDKVPHNAIALYDRPGAKDGRAMRTGEVLTRWSSQIKVRSDDYRKGWSKAEAIAAQLDAVLRLGIDAGNYLYFCQSISRSQIMPLGVEDGPKRRYSFTINCDYPLTEEGPYPEWGNTNEELYDAIYHFHEVVHVTLPDYFGA